MSDEVVRNKNYTDLVYSREQIRDCIKGSNSVKRKQEIYLPMPSGMLAMVPTASTTATGNNRNLSVRDFPWYHENPAYSAYLHRARFPDITGSVLRGITGMMTKQIPEYDLPVQASEFESVATVCGKSIIELYGYSVGEVMQTGKICYVIDIKENNKPIIAVYSAERNPDWSYGVVDGERVLTSATFIDEFATDDVGEKSTKYELVNGIAISQQYISGKPVGDEVILTYVGKTLSRLPIFFAGAVDNSADTDVIPLTGISDTSLTIYRKDADLSQAEYMTCNPTLFIYGLTQDQTPQVIGSTVTVTISNPQAKAEYPATDTSALDHVSKTIDGLYSEAISMGAQILGVGKKGAESAEALTIREASSGATLITIVNLTSKAITDALKFIDAWAGSSGVAEFKGSVDFTDHSMTAQEQTAMVASWLNRAISHDTLLDNFRAANVVGEETTNQQEKNKIKNEEEDILTSASADGESGD